MSSSASSPARDEPESKKQEQVRHEVAIRRGAIAQMLVDLRFDVPASVVVFLVALPLCLGIAVASGTTEHPVPPLAGLVTGVVGGVVVAWISGSRNAVSGPAAGLTVIVATAISSLGYEGMLLAVALAGGMQILFGLLRAGIFAYYFPTSVIKGMLAAIGVILILKQIPHAVGFDADYEGDFAFFQADGRNTLSEIPNALAHMHLGAMIVSLVGLALLIVLERSRLLSRIKWLPAPLLVVGLGIGLNALFGLVAPSLHIDGELLVRLPTGGLREVAAELSFPAFGQIGEQRIWESALTIAVVASLETLLCIEAMDKLDPEKRSTPTNRELVAQGIGNAVAGLLGGLPMTAVVVRGSANIQAGARSRTSAFLHGVWLLVAVLLLPVVINLMPLAILASVLLRVGYKLSTVGLYRHMFKQPAEQWLPFLITIVAILFTDLLKGVGIGMGVALFFVLLRNLQTPYFLHRAAREEGRGTQIKLELSENVSFLNKAGVSKVLHEMPDGMTVEIDGTRSVYIHPDVVELIHEFADTARHRGIDVTLTSIPAPPGGPSGH
ncbi:MAG: SulP family inorganic anion transporter [Sandaracinaceae bacterium]|nr:SulP family inorganic anion transporter [Sandaracinaceae bacterium]